MGKLSLTHFPMPAASIAAILVTLLSLPTVTRAAGPVALVESISGAPPGIEWMDYLSAGKVIPLTSHDGLVIDYLQSCIRETIKGGIITVGAERSGIEGGSVERERVRCDGRSLLLTPEQSQTSAGAVSRFQKKVNPLPAGVVIQRHLYGASPIFDLGGENALAVERLDRSEDLLVLQLPPERLVRGRFYDLATDRQALTPGGIYRASVGQRSVVFQIDRSAKPGSTPLAERLLQLW